MMQTHTSLNDGLGKNVRTKYGFYNEDIGDYRNELIDSVEVEKQKDPFTGGYSIIRSRRLELRLS